jgi:hypothetical protein
MFQPLSSLVASFDDFEDTPVTVRCRIAGEPQSGSERGRKTLYRVTDATGSVPPETFISFWHTEPNLGGSSLRQTDSEVLSLVAPDHGGNPLAIGEEVIVRGVPKYVESTERYFINVTSVLLRRPDLQIGKGQLRLPNECGRLLHLLFEKNVYRPRDSFGGNAKTGGSFRGNIAHKSFEYAITRQPYLDYFADDLWERDAVESLVQEVLNEEYLIEQALHSLRWTGKNRAIEQATDAIELVLTNETLRTLIAESDEVSSEVGLSQSYGFDGQVDLIVDGVPFDLKTASEKRADVFQIKLYLFSLLLQRLDAGDDIWSEIESGIAGFLIYADSRERSAEFKRVELTRADAANIMDLRNEIASARSRFGVPSPYGEDCEGCILRYGDDHGGLDDEFDPMPSACKFHCQSERRWPCYEVGEDYKFETKCPLFDDCEQRLEFRNPEITDHYNELRSALQAERDVRQTMGEFLEQVSEESLVRAGLVQPELSIEGIVADRRIAYSSPTATGFQPGDEVEISQSSGSEGWRATYLGQWDGRYIYEFETRPGYAATSPDATFEARRAPCVTALPQKFLRYLDFAQRTGIDPRLATTNGGLQANSESATISSCADLDFESVLEASEVYVDLPVRSDRDEVATRLIEGFTSTPLPKLRSAGTVPDTERRTLVLCSRPLDVETFHTALREKDEYWRFDGSDADAKSLPGGRTQHELKEALKDAQVLVSSTQFAISEEVFHYMASGDPDHRPHSSKFFDTVILHGADRLAEPAFHFLSKLADRTIAIADVRRRGIDLLSTAAMEADLNEPYFKRAFNRYGTIDAPDVATVQFQGSASADAIQSLDDPRLGEEGGGSVTVINHDGAETNATETFPIEGAIASGGDEPKSLSFALTNASTSIAELGEMIGRREELDASGFEPGEEYVIDETVLNCLDVSPIDNEDATQHRLTIRVPVAETPFLSSRFVSNQTEATRAVDIAIQRDADLLLTPFVPQARLLSEAVNNRGESIPVQLTGEWSGLAVDEVVVSTVVANDSHLVHPPLNQYETLYTILTAGTSVTLVGDQDTLKANDILREEME